MARHSCLLLLSAAVLIAAALGSPLNNDKQQVTKTYFYVIFAPIFFIHVKRRNILLFSIHLCWKSRMWTTTNWESLNNYRSSSRNATSLWNSAVPRWPCRPETWKTTNWAWRWGCLALQSQEVSTRLRLLWPLYDLSRGKFNAPVVPLPPRSCFSTSQSRLRFRQTP